MLAVLVLTILFFHFSKNTSFDTNMHHINYMTKEQEQKFQQLIEGIDSNTCTLYCIAEGSTLDEALENNEKIFAKTHGWASIQQVNGIGNFMPSTATQEKRLKRWHQFWKDKKEPFFRNLDKALCQLPSNPAKTSSTKNMKFKISNTLI
jgi:hypothetical protein